MAANAARAPETARLADRPEARPWKVEDLIAAIRKGQMWIPGFQRDLRWTEKEAIALLDSIDRGFPIGILLLWKGKAPVADIEIGTLKVARDEKYPGFAIVDGQQRLTWLVQALEQGVSAAGRQFVFDLESAEFKVLARNETASLSQVPADCLLDSAKLMKWVFDHAEQLSDEDRAVLFELGKRIRDYPIPSYIIATDEEATVREVFRRQNSTGKQLLESDVFNAINQRGVGHVGPPSAGVFFPTTLRELSEQLEAEQFGRIDESVLVRIVKALDGFDVAESFRSPTTSRVDISGADAMQRAGRGVRAAIRFLRDDANIPHIELLPYTLPLVTLAVFFDAHPEPKARYRALLARWIWRGAVSGAHQGGTVTTRAALASVRRAQESEAVQALLRQVDVPHRQPPFAAARFRMNFAASKLIINAMFEARPLSLVDSSEPEVPLTQLFDAMRSGDSTRHATKLPHLVNPSRSAPRLDIYSSSANFLLHPHVRMWSPSRQLRQASPRALASHFLDQDIVALLAKDPAQALVQRAQRMQRALEACIDRHAAWDAPDRPAIQDLVLDDEVVE